MRTADQERAFEAPLHERNPLKAIVEHAIQQKKFGPDTRSAIAPERAKLHVEQCGHGGACAMRRATRQGRHGEWRCLTGAGLWAMGARFRTSAALRRLRH